MSRSKPDPNATLAEQRLADLELVFAALAHEQRRHILLTLKFRGGEMTAGAAPGGGFVLSARLPLDANWA